MQVILRAYFADHTHMHLNWYLCSPSTTCVSRIYWQQTQMTLLRTSMLAGCQPLCHNKIPYPPTPQTPCGVHFLQPLAACNTVLMARLQKELSWISNQKQLYSQEAQRD